MRLVIAWLLAASQPLILAADGTLWPGPADADHGSPPHPCGGDGIGSVQTLFEPAMPRRLPFALWA